MIAGSGSTNKSPRRSAGQVKRSLYIRVSFRNELPLYAAFGSLTRVIWGKPAQLVGEICYHYRGR